MRAKEREAILQRWRSAIQREIRDQDSLEQVAARAMNDPDVRMDSTMESMIRSEIENRRASFQPDEQHRSPPPSARPFGSAARIASPHIPAPTPPNPVRVAFDGLAKTFSRLLEDGDADEACAVAARMRMIHEESPQVVPAAAVEPYERQVGKLRMHLENINGQIAALTKDVVLASHDGNEIAVASLIHRLTAIHVAYPRLLNEQRLDEIRGDTIDAAEQHEEHLRVKELVERERVLAAEIKKLAVAVQAFHRIAHSAPRDSGEFRSAEAAYVLTIQEIAAHDSEWVAGIVLELADLLADCAVPPPGAADRIDRFLDSIRSSLQHIRGVMRKIETER